MSVCVFAASAGEIGPIISKTTVLKKRKLENVRLLSGHYEGQPLTIAISGMGQRRALAATRQLLDQIRPEAVVILGVSGGLTEQFSSGQSFIVNWVGHMSSVGSEIAEKLYPATDLAEHGSFLPTAGLVSVDRIVCSAAKKRVLGSSTGAAGVDLETYCVAQCLDQSGVPWMAIRSISDTVDDELPEAVQSFVDADTNRRSHLRSIGKMAAQAGLTTMIDLKRKLDRCSSRLEADFRSIHKSFLS